MESISLDGVDQVRIDEAKNVVTAVFHKDLYPIEAIYGAAYLFIERCYVFLDAPDGGSIRVQLKGRTDVGRDGLAAYAGELANELLAQAWRAKIFEQNKTVLETVATRALTGLDDLGDLDDLDSLDDDVFDDPLGIAQTWEEKHEKDPPPGAGEGSPSANEKDEP